MDKGAILAVILVVTMLGLSLYFFLPVTQHDYTELYFEGDYFVVHNAHDQSQNYQYTLLQNSTILAQNALVVPAHTRMKVGLPLQEVIVQLSTGHTIARSS